MIVADHLVAVLFLLLSPFVSVTNTTLYYTARLSYFNTERTKHYYQTNMIYSRTLVFAVAVALLRPFMIAARISSEIMDKVEAKLPEVMDKVEAKLLEGSARISEVMDSHDKEWLTEVMDKAENLDSHDEEWLIKVMDEVEEIDSLDEEWLIEVMDKVEERLIEVMDKAEAQFKKKTKIPAPTSSPSCDGNAGGPGRFSRLAC